MAQWSVRSACDRGSQATFAKVGHRMGDQNLLSRSSKGTLSRWFWLYLQTLAPTTLPRSDDVRQAKKIANSLLQHLLRISNKYGNVTTASKNYPIKNLSPRGGA
jgi:hypothetical protein